MSGSRRNLYCSSIASYAMQDMLIQYQYCPFTRLSERRLRSYITGGHDCCHRAGIQHSMSLSWMIVCPVLLSHPPPPPLEQAPNPVLHHPSSPLIAHCDHSLCNWQFGGLLLAVSRSLCVQSRVTRIPLPPHSTNPKHVGVPDTIHLLAHSTPLSSPEAHRDYWLLSVLTRACC